LTLPGPAQASEVMPRPLRLGFEGRRARRLTAARP